MFERKNHLESHSWVQERLSAFMDNQLPPRERAQVDRHLRECNECQRLLASLQWTVSLLKQAPAPVLPRSFLLPVPKAAPRVPLIGLGVLRFATAMATLLLISLIGIDLILQNSSVGSTATSFAPRVAAVPPTSAPPTQAASHAANAATEQDGVRVPTTAPVLNATSAPTAAPPPAALPPAALPTAAPPAVAPKPAQPSAPTSAPAATAAPPVSAAQSQSSATSRPSVRASVPQSSPTPANLPGQGRGGNEKSSQDNAAATAAPLLSQPQSLGVAPTATPSSTATETPSPAPATATITPAPPAATAIPRREALAQPTSIPATPPTVASPTENVLPISPLRIAELAVLFVAVFLGVLTLLLRR